MTLVIHVLTKARTVCIVYKIHYREAVVKPVRTAQELVKKQFDDYVEKSLEKETEPIVHKEKHHSTV